MAIQTPTTAPSPRTNDLRQSGWSPPSQNALTIACFFRSTAGSGAYRAFAHLHDNGPELVFQIDSGNHLSFYEGGDKAAQSGTVSLDTWYFGAWTCNAGSLATFQGAVASPATALTTATGTAGGVNTAPTNFDFLNDGYDEPWFGRVESLRIWTAVLTAAELERERRSLAPVRLANLFAWYRWRNIADRLVDYSGGGRNLVQLNAGTPNTVTADGPGVRANRRRQQRPIWTASVGGGTEATARAAQILSPEATATARAAQQLELEKTVTARAAQLVSPEATGTARAAQLLSAEKTVLARAAQVLTPEATGTGRAAGLLTLEATGTARAAATLALEATALARAAQLLSGEKSVVARAAQLLSFSADVEGTARAAQILLLEALATARAGNLVSLEALAVTRAAQRLSMEANRVARAAQLLQLEATGFTRAAQVLTLEASGSERAANLITAEAQRSARAANVIQGEAGATARAANLVLFLVQRGFPAGGGVSVDGNGRVKVTSGAASVTITGGSSKVVIGG